MHILDLAFILLCISLWYRGETSAAETCRAVPDENIRGYTGFPAVNIKFSSAVQSIFTETHMRDLSAGPGINISCKVTDLESGTVVSRTVFTRYHFFDMVTKLPVAYVAKVITSNANYTVACTSSVNATTKKNESNDGICVSYTVVVTVEDFTARDCFATPVTLRRDEVKITVGEITSIFCKVPDSLDKDGFAITWFRYTNDSGCTKMSGRGDLRISEEKLEIKSPDFRDAGTYVCMATYNETKVALLKANVCIRHKLLHDDEIKPRCSIPKVSINEDAKVICTISISISKSAPGQFYWYKVTADGYDTEICNKSYTADATRMECSAVTSLPEDPCYYSKPSDDVAKDIRNVTLILRNVQESDFGLYRLDYFPWHLDGGKVIANVTLERNYEPTWMERADNIALVVLLSVLMVVIAILLFLKRIELLWLHKKYFGSPENVGVNQYTATFLYHYDLENYNDHLEMRRTKALVESMHELLGKIGGTVYDENQNTPLRQGKAENVMEAHNQSQRILIFLSPTFLRDHWSRYVIYSAIESAIREGKKIIVIAMKDTKRSIKELDDGPRTALQIVMKRNFTIYWDGTIPFDGKFRRHLEYALPKLAT